MKSQSLSFRRLCTLVSFCLCAMALQAQVITPFTLRKQVTQRGGIRFVGNTISTCSGTSCATGQAEVAPAGTSSNNGFTSAYVDIDGDGTTFSSSSDVLALSSCSEVTWAGLYWGGEITNIATNYATRNQVKIKTNTGSYVSLTADNIQDNAVGYDSYHCFKEVTSIIQAGGNATYTVANVAARVGGTNRFGGWCLVVMYKNDLEPMRSLNVFNGLSNVSGSNPISDIAVSGFLTPLSGPVSFELGAFSYDGDRASTGDQLMFNGGNGFVNISDAVNLQNDIFNSTFSYNGVTNTSRNPSYNNTLGVDADIFVPNNAAKNFIGNSATSATMRLTTGGETFITQMVTLAIDVYEPDMRLKRRYTDINGGSIQPGDIIEYALTAKNVGSDPSVNSFVVDTVPFNADYVTGSLQVTYGANTGAKTDASGDDQAEYIAASKAVRFRVGTGANAVSGGQINNSSTGTDSTVVKYRITVTNECFEILCKGNINSVAQLNGTGNVSGNTLTAKGYNEAVVSGCTQYTDDALTITASCSSISASSNSPVTGGGSIQLSVDNVTGATYSWTGPNSFVSVLRQPIITNATTANQGTYNVTITVTGSSCTQTASTNVVVNTFTWVGSVSSTWNDPNNWSGNLVPTSYAAVTIPTGTANVASYASGSTTISALAIASGVFLYNSGTINITDSLVNAGALSGGIVTVAGNLRNSGSIINNVVLNLSGSSAQTINGTGTIRNITINNSAGVSINSGITSITGTYTPTSGMLATNERLVFKSTSTRTANIASGSGSIVGKVTVERYIAGGRRAYRFMGHPFKNAIALSQYTDDIDITGGNGAASGLTTTTNNAPSSYYYNPLLGDESPISDPGWRSYNNSNETVAKGAGFRLFARGSKGQANIFLTPYASPQAATITITDTLNPINADFVQPLVKGTNSGYNLIANPYLTPIDISTLTKTASVNANYWLWNARLGTQGGYLTYTFGVNNYALPHSASFFVKATTTNQTITFKSTDKTATDTSTMLRQVPIKGLLEMSVHADGNMYDRFTMFINDKAKTGYDELLDAAKFRNAEANFYSLSKDGKALAVDVRPFDGIAIPMGFTSNMQKSYTISIDNMNLDKRNELYLKDNYTGTYLLLQTGSSYDFKVDANAASQGEQRFELVAKTSKPISLITKSGVEVYPNPTTHAVTIKYNGLNIKENTTINIVDANGKVVKTINAGKQSSINQTMPTKSLPSGIYTIEVVNGKEKQSQPIIKQ